MKSYKYLRSALFYRCGTRSIGDNMESPELLGFVVF
jgi:hypothetical protein